MTLEPPNSCCQFINGHAVCTEKNLLQPLWEFPVRVPHGKTLDACTRRHISIWPDDLTSKNFCAELSAGAYKAEVYVLRDLTHHDRLVDLGVQGGKVMPGSLGLAYLCGEYPQNLPDGLIISPHTLMQRFQTKRTVFGVTAMHDDFQKRTFALHLTVIAECAPCSFVIYFRREDIPT